MALNWCFNEPWITAGNNSLVAYPSIPKPALFAVANSLSGQVPSARIPKFHWDAGETFSAQLWYLNDLPQSAQDEVTVTLTVNGETHNLLTWQTNEVSANENKLGPTVNFVLPKESTNRDLILTLTGSSGRKNSYILHFTGKIRKKSSLLMNQ
jgi:beta-mannosidase